MENPRIEMANRMECRNVRLQIDDRTVSVNVDFQVEPTGVTPVALWVRVKPEESTLGKELRASGKSNSLLLQSGWSLKEIADTLTKDSYMGSAVTYITKNIEDIWNNVQPEKTPRMSTDPYKIK
tara:strand:- start:114 stop:485 length:372 start_codon:yes stop_codon:yes gene_type:complete